MWCLRLCADPSTLENLRVVLNDEERERADRFRFPLHRDHFVIARGVLRRLLARFLGIAAGDVEFQYAPKGKPECKSGRALRFNLSHSGDMAIYAFAHNREVGIDIEQHREMKDLEAIAKRFFAAGEVEDLMSLAPADRPDAFFRCWTRKEAFIKAIGDGLSLPLDSFRVSLFPDQTASIVDTPAEQRKKWQLIDVTPCTGYSAALVTEAGPLTISQFAATTVEKLLLL
ncbi:MAG TPA: 4'-phosphopantetheinyl transferase superfamily protein [Bryobacteraceae bacterium]|nr:4'-phosphopantetheinyl transferase superfamily protein [Bryobacteraceae bacterium]